MSDTQPIEWSSMEIPGGKCQYTSVTPLEHDAALQLQGEIIGKLGKANEHHKDKHKKFPCIIGVVGVGQYQLTMVATPGQFDSVFPDAAIIQPAAVSRTM